MRSDTRTEATLRTDEIVAYLNDHDAGSAAGTDLAEGLAKRIPSFKELGELAELITEDQATLQRLMGRFDSHGSVLKRSGVLSAEKLATTILSDDSEGRKHLTDLRQLEMLSMGIRGKLCLWLALDEIAQADERLQGYDFPRLADRARYQLQVLEDCLRRISRKAFLG